MAGSVGCSKATSSSSVLDPKDLTAVQGQGAFNRDAVVDPAAFVDVQTLDATAIEDVLSGNRSPYGRVSFLAHYQSNGVRASEAIARTATQYRINPLVLLVHAQAAEGLVASATYPLPPDRVEYVFRCGCFQGNRCDPAAAGFDRQVDCLGHDLRVALDAIAQDGHTISNWGPGQASLTLDGVSVTPQDDATAAIYDHLPVVAEGQAGGSWLFWNLWNRFAVALDYRVSVGSPSSPSFFTDVTHAARTAAASSPTWPFATTASTEGVFWNAALTRKNASM